MSLFARGAETYSGLIDRLPRRLGLVVGAFCVVLGVLLVLNPFGSLAVLLVLLAVGLVLNGVAEILHTDRHWIAGVLGVLLIAAGVLVLVVPALTISLLTVVVGVALILDGATSIVRAVRGTTDQRAAHLMLGLAAVALGVLALTWRDVTVFVIAALFGVRLLLFGVDHVLAAVRQQHGADPTPRPSRLRPWMRTIGAATALAVSVGLLFISDKLSGTPSIDDFYAVPADLPDEPGRLLRAEEFTRSIPDNATAWRILYTTTDANEAPAVASALVVAPAAGEEHPVVAWAHGTTGFASPCAPSLLPQPFVAGAMPAFEEALDQGWAVVATDYAGLGVEGIQPYLIGTGEGYSVLDSVRAAQQLVQADLGERTVMWGHSQGGHAALWAGGLATEYAPDLTIAGVAAMAPAANLPQLLDGLGGSMFGAILGSFMLAAYDGTYPDVAVNDYVRPGARIMIQSMYRRCLSDPASIVSVGTSILSQSPPWSQQPTDGPLAKHAEQNVPTKLITAPLLLAQGDADGVIDPAGQGDYVDARCAAGQVLSYRTYPGRDHLSLVAADSPLVPELLTWTQARFDGEASANTCPA